MRGVGRLARDAIVGSPQRAAVAVAGHVAALGLVAAGPSAGHLKLAYQQGGVLLVAAVALGAASAVDRRDLRASAAADLCGASRLQRRLAVVVEAVAVAVAALPVGLAVGGLACEAADVGNPDMWSAGLAALLVPTVVGLFAGRLRTRVTVVDATGDRFDPEALPRRMVDGVRVVLGLGLVVATVGAASRIRTFAGLDVGLPFLLLVAAAGLLLLLPPLVGAVGAALFRARPLSLALAGAGLRDRRHLVAPAVAVGAVAAFLVAVQAVVGLGLAHREQARRAELEASYQFTAGLGDRMAVVGRFSSTPGFGWASGIIRIDEEAVIADPPLPAGLADRVRRATPGASVVEVELLPAEIRGDPVVARATQRRAAPGSPELLEALGLQDFADDLAAGRALALDPSAVVDGSVTIYDFGTLPAIAVQHGTLPQYLPAVLVPPEVADDLWAQFSAFGDVRYPSLLVIGRDRAIDPDEVTAIARVVNSTADSIDYSGPVRTVPGGRRIASALEQGRLDSSYAVVLESTADVRVAVFVSLVVALVALAVALRLAELTGRSDDELLDVLGAPTALLQRSAAAQALVLAALAVPLGTAVGVLASRIGLAAYNGSSAVGPGELPPIPFVVPGELVAGAAVVVMVATAVAWGLARRRRAPDLQAMADGLAW